MKYTLFISLTLALATQLSAQLSQDTVSFTEHLSLGKALKKIMPKGEYKAYTHESFTISAGDTLRLKAPHQNADVYSSVWRGKGVAAWAEESSLKGETIVVTKIALEWIGPNPRIAVHGFYSRIEDSPLVRLYQTPYKGAFSDFEACPLNFYTRDEAVALIAAAKQEYDLGLMSEAEFTSIRERYRRFIK